MVNQVGHVYIDMDIHEDMFDINNLVHSILGDMIK